MRCMESLYYVYGKMHCYLFTVVCKSKLASFVCLPPMFFFIAPTVKKGKYLSELPNSDDALLNRLTFSDLPW